MCRETAASNAGVRKQLEPSFDARMAVPIIHDIIIVMSVSLRHVDDAITVMSLTSRHGKVRAKCQFARQLAFLKPTVGCWSIAVV